MSERNRPFPRASALALIVGVSLVCPPVVLAQVGTAFTYQGRLTQNGTPASGSFDLQFELWDALSGGAQVGSTVTLSGVSVTSGLFTVSVDFGAGMFTGSRRWLEIGVAPGGSGGPFTTLAPRQELTPVASAIYASAAGSAATLNGLSCANGQVAKWSGSAWSCGTDVDTNSGGTVTSVGSGAGLAGGPVTGAGTLSIAPGGVVTSMIAAGAVTRPKIADGAVGANQIDTTQVQTRLSAACAVGEYLRGVNADGSVLCGTFTLPPLISTVTAPPTSTVGFFTSLAIGQDGFPVIAFYDSSTKAAKVAKCLNAACSASNTVTVDSVNDVGQYISIAIGQDGFPVLSYLDFTVGALKVAKCVTAGCGGGGAIITNVDLPPPDVVGGYTSIAVGTDGFPVISYYDYTATALKVAKCVNAACTGTSTLTTVDHPAADVGQWTAIAIGTDGFPVISYQNVTAKSLKVAKCVNAACTGTSTITTVDNPANAVAVSTAIAIGSDGFPIVSYFDQTANALKVAKCANAACTGSSTITTVDSDNGGAYSSIAIGGDGLPVIAYLGSTPRVAKCNNLACSSRTITTIDAFGISYGAATSLGIGTDSLPVISYEDSVASALKVIKCNKPNCVP